MKPQVMSPSSSFLVALVLSLFLRLSVPLVRALPSPNLVLYTMLDRSLWATGTLLSLAWASAYGLRPQPMASVLSSPRPSHYPVWNPPLVVSPTEAPVAPPPGSSKKLSLTDRPLEQTQGGATSASSPRNTKPPLSASAPAHPPPQSWPPSISWVLPSCHATSPATAALPTSTSSGAQTPTPASVVPAVSGYNDPPASATSKTATNQSRTPGWSRWLSRPSTSPSWLELS